jgi:hypothetical protein
MALSPGNASDFVYVRITAPDRPGIAHLCVGIFYANTLLQWLKTTVRVVPPGDQRDTVSQLLEVSSHVSTLRELGVTTVAEMAALSDNDIEALAEKLDVPTAQAIDWRRQAVEFRGLGNETTVVYTISPGFIGFEAFQAPTVTIVFDSANGEVHVKGPGEGPHPCKVAPGLGNSLARFRQLMASINERAPDDYRFQPDNR